MDICSYNVANGDEYYSFHLKLCLTDAFRAKYGKWLGLGEENYDKYRESLRKADEEGEGVVLVFMDEGDKEGVLRLLEENGLDSYDDLVRCSLSFSLFFMCVCLILSGCEGSFLFCV